MCMLVSGCGLWIVYALSERALVAGLRVHLEDLAQLTAGRMDVAAHRALESGVEPGSPAYHRVSEPLLQLREQVSDIYYAYTLAMRGDQPVFVLDSSYYVKNQNDPGELAMPGEVYEEAPQALFDAWRSKDVVSCHEPYTDKWGTFLSAFAPFRANDGEVVGVVGVDISMAQLAARQKPVHFALLMAVLACFVGSAVIGVLRARSHARLVEREAELLVARADAVRGEMSARAGEQTKSVFLATMSHEIRTPLNGVLGMAEALSQTPLNPEQVGQLQAIRSSGNLLLAMLNDILDFSKMEAGSMLVHVQPLYLLPLVQTTANLYRASADNKGLGLVVECDPGAPRHALADPNRLRQVIGNLLSNAIKFSSHGAIRIRIEAGANGMVDIAVEDSGIGISEEQLKDLFKPFSQLDTALTRQAGGTGLGLAISRRLVELMGGRLGVESVVGRGSSFRVSLPVTDELPQEPDPQPMTAAVAVTASPLKVIVAEDVAINRQVAGLLLKRMGIAPSFAEDGAQAVQMWRDLDPDVILMDVQMPIVDGREATRRIRAQSGDPQRPWIIALTGGVMGEDVEEATKAGMNDFLAKPIDMATLAAALAKVPPRD